LADGAPTGDNRKIRGHRSLRVVVVAAAVGAGLLIAISARSSKSAPDEFLRVVVSGRATVVAEPGGRDCRTRCVWRYDHGTRVRLRVRSAAGARFLGWQGDCTGMHCRLGLTRARRVIARFSQPGSEGLQSWSFHVDCAPVGTTIAELVGSRLGADGAPLEMGGAFRPHLRGLKQQHLLDPPCRVGGTRTFVEIDDVAVSGPVVRQGDADVVTHVLDTRLRTPNRAVKTLRVEIDAAWLRAGVPVPDFPSQPARIDLQGFVFWDTGHLVGESREPSGWELHPVAAWLPALGR
jgi:hypothetical protein